MYLRNQINAVLSEIQFKSLLSILPGHQYHRYTQFHPAPYMKLSVLPASGPYSKSRGFSFNYLGPYLP